MSRIPVGLGRSMRAAAGSILLVGVATMVGTAWPGIGQSTPENPFIVKPYLQLGDLPRLSSSEPVRVLWQAANDRAVEWTVDVRQHDTDPWRSAIVTGGRLAGTPDALYRLFTVPLTRLEPGREFAYRISRNGRRRFHCDGQDARIGGPAAYRFAVTGDTGADTAQERRVVYRMHRAQPDFFAIAGDIVYSTGSDGRVSCEVPFRFTTLTRPARKRAHRSSARVSRLAHTATMAPAQATSSAIPTDRRIS